MSLTKAYNRAGLNTLDTEQREIFFLRPVSLMQDAKEFRLTYSQNTLGQSHLHKKEKRKEEKNLQICVGHNFYNLCFPRASFPLGPPLISISDFQMSVKQTVSSWQIALLIKNIHKTPGLWMWTHRVSVTLSAVMSLLNDKLPEIFPYTFCTVINFQVHILVFYTISHFVPLFPFFPVNMKEASDTEKWLEWSRANPHPATTQLSSLCASVTLPPACPQKNGSCKGP